MLTLHLLPKPKFFAKIADMKKRVHFSNEAPELREFERYEWVHAPRQVQTRAEKKLIDDALNDSTPNFTVNNDGAKNVKRCTNEQPGMTNEQIEHLLHTRGFVVLREGTVVVDEEMRNDINQKTCFVPIFNDIDEHGDVTTDGLRLQGTGEWHSRMRTRLKEYLTKKGLLRNKQVKDVYALRSLPGCKRQPKHTDVAEPLSLINVHPDTVPLALIYALEDNTTLRIWPFTGGCVTIQMQTGFMVVFRGDLFHCGMEYAKQNTRIHAYIDSPSYKRKPNKTILASKHSRV
jgi:hypothetical protein